MRKILLIVATFLLVVAWSKDVVNATKDGNQINKDFTFLKIGNSWTHSQYEISNTGVEYRTSTLTYKVDTNINSIACVVYHADVVHCDGDVEKGKIMFIVTDSTVWDFDFDFDFPLFWKSYTVGQKWYNPLGFGILARKVVSINETITVKAGTFHNCIKIKEFYDSDREDFYWIRNDVGVIKIVRANEFVSELKSKNFIRKKKID